MADSIKIVVTKGGQTFEECCDLSGEGVGRVLAWAKAAYAKQPTEDDPNPAELTDAEAVAAFGCGIINGIKANVLRHEEEAARAAVAAPADL